MRTYLIVLATLPLMGLTFLDPVAGKNEEGNRLYGQERYEDALGRYQEAQAQAPELAQLHFNVGTALYKQGAYDQAIQEFSHVLKAKDPGLLAGAYYNTGNAHFKQQRLGEAAGAYKKTLEIAPDDLDAKINLEMVQELLKEQEKKEQDQKGQDKQQKKDDRQSQQQQGEQDKPEDQEQSDQGGEEGREDPREGENRERQDGRKDLPEEQTESQQAPQQGGPSKEESEQMFNAQKSREMEAQKRRRFRPARGKYRGEEW